MQLPDDGTFYEVVPTFVGYNLFPPTVNGRWRRSVFTGTLNVRGTVSHPAELRISLVSGSRTAASVVIRRDAAGEFSASFPLPKRGFLPGTYSVVITGQVTGRAMPNQAFPLTVRGPPEGVISRAFVTSIASVTPKRRLPSRSPGATAHFVFASLPARGRAITTTWSLGSRKLGTARKPRTKNIVSSVLLPGGLPNGRYTCVLRVGGKVLQVVRVRIG